MKKKLTQEQQVNLEKALQEQRESAKKFDEEIKQNRLDRIEITKKQDFTLFFKRK